MLNKVARHSVRTLAAAAVLGAGSAAEAQSNPDWADLTTLTAITLDLRVTSCNDPSRILMGGSGPRYYIDTVGANEVTSRQWVSVPQTPFRAGQVDVFGFRPAGVSTLGDLQSIRLGVSNANICVDKIELLANDHEVFTLTYEGGRQLIGTHYPLNESWLDIAAEQLRPELGSHGYAPEGPAICELPPAISGSALQRTIQGILGDSVYTAAGTATQVAGGRMTIKWAGYHSDDWTRLSSAGPDVIHVDTRFHAGTNWTSGSFGVDADVAVSMNFDIRPVCSDLDARPDWVNNALSLEVSPVNVTDVAGSDFIMDAVIGIVSSEGQIGATINARLDQVRSMLGAIVQNLPLCPPLSVTADGGIATNIGPELLEWARASGFNASLCR